MNDDIAPAQLPPASQEGRTPRPIIYTVIGAATAFSGILFVVLGALLFIIPFWAIDTAQKLQIFDKTLTMFIQAGTSAISFLFGTLVRTNAAPATSGTVDGAVPVNLAGVSTRKAVPTAPRKVHSRRHEKTTRSRNRRRSSKP